MKSTGISVEEFKKMPIDEIVFWLRASLRYEEQRAKMIEELSS